MKITPAQNAKMAKCVFASVYPYYVKKVVSKGRTKVELHKVIKWLTGFSEKRIQELIEKKVTLKDFYTQATINPKARLITGVICGYRVEEIENKITKRARYLDKLIDELAKGKAMDKVLRK